MSKSVKFQRPKASSAESWVQTKSDDTAAEAGPTRRLTVPLPVELHRRIKMWCVAHDRVMTDVIKELIEREFPESRV